MKTKYWRWYCWFLAAASLAAWLGWTLLAGEDKSLFLVGKTTDGHHQIELACESCHTSAFGGTELLQEACEGCHLEELQAVRDSHPRRKFTDPANAERVAVLDARVCVTCHREHQEDLTRSMAVTLPDDLCFLCHENVGEERSTHAGLPFDGCASSGCHNFHDNTALYEDFLASNAGLPWLSEAPSVPLANASTHVESGVTCAACHGQEQPSRPGFETFPDPVGTCSTCHANENSGFLAGKHGMRLAVGLAPMTPAQARIPMHASAAHESLSCVSCHAPHGEQRRFTVFESCIGCHASDHAAGYADSPHGRLLEAGFAGDLPLEQTVSCATCHMPATVSLRGGEQVVSVEHNQNANLRPSDKMLRSVCLNCHSLEFAIDALADAALLANNFSGRPAVHVESVDMALRRRAAARADRDDTYH